MTDKIWNKILKHQNEVFKTKRGLEFTYMVKNNQLVFSRAETYSHGISSLRAACNAWPVKGPGGFPSNVTGPSYFFGLLSDPRINP